MNELFIKRMKELLKDDFDAFINSLNENEVKGFYLNPLKKDVLNHLNHQYIEKHPYVDGGYYFDYLHYPLGKSPYFMCGLYYIQEPSAMSVAACLDIKENDYVLDMCGAPGGKTCYVASRLSNEGLMIANDISKLRASILSSNIERFGLKNTIVTNCDPLKMKFKSFFDKIILDAPCSGEGMFRKDNEAQQEWSYEHTVTCSVRQLEILNSAKTCLKENGVLVYSTCTYNKRENEGVITKFIEENPDFIIEDSGKTYGRNTLKYAKRIFINDGGEGHFCCRLRKTSSNDGYTEPYKYTKPKDEKKYLEFYDSIFNNRPFGNNLEVIKDKIYLLPNNMPNIKGLNVLRAGILLGEIKKNRIEPCHSAFMASKTEDCKSYVDLDINSEEIKKFLHGEEIPVPKETKGYTAVAVNGIVTGFGKASNGTLKNKYPKGLRNL